MKKNKTLTLFLLFGLLITIPLVTGVLQKSGFELRISALENDEPSNVIVSDIKENSFKVTWITEREVIGGISITNGTQFNENDSSSYHTIDIIGLKPSTIYTFKLLSNTKSWTKEDGSDYSVKTSGTITSKEKFLIYGQVFSADGYSFQQGGIISMQLRSGTLNSELVSAIINETGGYQMNIGGVLSDGLDRTFPYEGDNDVVFKIYITNDQTAIEKNYTINFVNNRQIPNIYLGEVNIDIIPGVEGE